MNLAQNSHLKLERFWREYLNDESFGLPQIYIYHGRFAGILTETLKIDGITFGKHIFIAPKLVTRNSKHHLKISSNLIAHEIAHTLQYGREGFFGFLYKYLKGFRRNLRQKEKWSSNSVQIAYWNIPFEIEAREIASKFITWSLNRKIE